MYECRGRVREATREGMARRQGSISRRTVQVGASAQEAVLEAPDPASTSFRQRDPFDGCNAINNIVKKYTAGVASVVCLTGKLLLETSPCNHAVSSEKHYTCVSDPLIQSEMK